MAKIGRNAPCPCGSGKKYKKCCMGTPRDPAARGLAMPSRGGPTRRSIREIEEGLREIAYAVHEATDTMPFLLSGVCLDLGLSPRLFAAGGDRGALVGMLVAAPSLVGDGLNHHPIVRGLLDSSLARLIHQALCESAARVYEVRAGRVVEARPAMGPARAYTRVVMLSADAQGSYQHCVGTLISVGQIPTLVVWEWLDRRLVAEIEDEAEYEGLLYGVAEHEFWDIIGATVARMVLDPIGNLGEFDSASYFTAFQDVDELVANDLASAGVDEALTVRVGDRKHKLQWVREIIARGEPEAMAGLVEAIGALADGWSERGGEQPAGDVASKVLARFGTDRTGSVKLDEPAVLRQPYALLHLPSDHPVHAALHADAPIRLALEWAEPGGPRDRADEVTEAWAIYRRELRWFATFEVPDAAPVWYPRCTWSHRQHAIAELFHPAIGDTPLSQLGMKKSALGRLRKALGALEHPAPDEARLRDLPLCEQELTMASGYGAGSHDELLRCVEEHLSTWRARAAGVDLDALARRAQAAAEDPTLAEGLDELAKLFS